MNLTERERAAIDHGKRLLELTMAPDGPVQVAAYLEEMPDGAARDVIPYLCGVLKGPLDDQLASLGIAPEDRGPTLGVLLDAVAMAIDRLRSST